MTLKNVKDYLQQCGWNVSEIITELPKNLGFMCPLSPNSGQVLYFNPIFYVPLYESYVFAIPNRGITFNLSEKFRSAIGYCNGVLLLFDHKGKVMMSIYSKCKMGKRATDVVDMPVENMINASDM